MGVTFHSFIDWDHLRSFLTLKRFPLLFTFILSCLYAMIGFTCLATIAVLDQIVYFMLFLLGFISFFSTGILTFTINKKKSIRILVFAGILLLISFLTFVIPITINLSDIGFSASLSNQLILQVFLIAFGMSGGILAISAMYNFSPIGSEKGAYLLIILCILAVIYPLFIILFQVIVNGAPGITWEFLTEDVRDIGAEGGIFPAIVGTMVLMIIIIFVAIPLGVGAGIYLEEYAGEHIFVRMIKTSVSILRGVPSIVFGLFGLAFFAPIFGLSFLTGGLALSCYALPMIIRTSSEALKGIPNGLREGSYALGASKWQTIRRVILPPALPGIITGIVLGIGEAIGETAVIMFFATLSIRMPPNLFDSIASLPTHLYTLFVFRSYGTPEEVAQRTQNIWSTALVLLIIVLALNVVGLIIREKYRKEF